MGCKNSVMSFGNDSEEGISSASKSVPLGSGVQINKKGYVDFSGRNIDFFSAHLAKVLQNDMYQKIKILDLSNNSLYTFGKELSQFSRLEEINLSGNKFAHLPQNLVLLESLENLNVSNNPLKVSKGFEILPKLVKLKQLILSDCKLTSLPHPLFDCTSIEYLDLSSNTGISFQKVNFSSLVNLQTLLIANCGITGKLPASIKQLKALTVLDISNNNFHFDDDFFGPNISASLKELQLRKLNLTSLPQAIIQLKRLSSLDLAENPLETLDVLAGRLVRRLGHKAPSSPAVNNLNLSNTQDKEPAANSNNNLADAEVEPACETESWAESNISMSKLSKAGIVTTLPQPIPLKKLSLRNCQLRTVPRYFHKLQNLEELDLSENADLDDPNMTLFSLHSLRVLNVTGCPFTIYPGGARQEWFDIAKLRNLRDLQWEIWKGTSAINPYRTKVPIEICGLHLRRINEINLRPHLFVGDAVETIVNLMCDGYFKVSLSIDDSVVYAYISAGHFLENMEEFFFPCISDLSEAENKKLGELRLQVSLNRYAYFLAMQAANYDSIIVPPTDVIALHYALMTINPVAYRSDCEAVCGRILNCNYRRYFLELSNEAKAKEFTGIGKRIWNLSIRAAQKDLKWLRYSFWEKLAKYHEQHGNGSAPAPEAQEAPPVNPSSSARSAAVFELEVLSELDSSNDLLGLLDPAITSYFTEVGTKKFRTALADFFKMNRCFLDHEDYLRKKKLDWTRYVKYITLYTYSYRARRGGIRHIEDDDDDASSAQKKYATRSNAASTDSYYVDPFSENFQLKPKRTLSPGAASLPNNKTNTTVPQNNPKSASAKHISRLQALSKINCVPVPSIGLTVLLYAHRTAHLEYYQTLSLLEIQDADIYWTETPTSVQATAAAWNTLYEECYVDRETQELEFRVKFNTNETSSLNSPTDMLKSEYEPMPPRRLQSALKPSTVKKRNSGKRVKLMFGDTEYNFS